jgi:non-specific serine/threonine protein kinase
LAVLEICTRLDGLPLAIELAAAQVKVLSPGAIVGRLTRSSGAPASLQVLAHGPRDLPPRQRDLRSTIEWSSDLLSASEQVLFRRLAVFSGGFTLQAAIALNVSSNAELEQHGHAAAGAAPEMWLSDAGSEEVVLAGLSALVEQNLLGRQADSAPDGAERFRLLETVREFALERLDASGEGEVFRRRHAEVFGAVADFAEDGLIGAEQLTWLQRLDREHDNFRAALRCAIDHGYVALAFRLGWGLWRYWAVRGWYTEGRGWLKAMLALAQGADHQVLHRRVAWAAGRMAYEHGDYGESRDLLSKSLAIAREAGDSDGVAMALTQLGHVAFALADYAVAGACYQDGREIRARLGDHRGLAISLLYLGVLARAQGDNARARSLLGEAVRMFGAIDDRFMIASARGHLADVELDAGDLARARRLLGESLATLRVLGARLSIVRCLEREARLALVEGRFATVLRLGGAASAFRSSMGATLLAAELADVERMLGAARSALSAETAAQQWALGRAMTVDEAMDLALGTSTDVSEPPEPTQIDQTIDRELQLTPRQREVAALVARGLTNQEIASALVISQRTAETHVQNVLTKLDLTSRSQLAVWAHQRGLIPNTGAGSFNPAVF